MWGRELRVTAGRALATLRQPNLQRRILVVVGAALLVTTFVPLGTSPKLVFTFSAGQPTWRYLMWPLVAGCAYIVAGAAPSAIRRRLPTIMLRWSAFVASCIGVLLVSRGGGDGGDTMGFAADSIYILGYAILVFGLLSRIAQPHDGITRVVIGLGAAMLLPECVKMFGALHVVGVPPLLAMTSLLHLLVTLLGVACFVAVVPVQNLPTALHAIGSLAPVVAAILIIWLPVMVLLYAVVTAVHFHAGWQAIFWLVRALIYMVAFFGVFFMLSPAAYAQVQGGAGALPEEPLTEP